MPTFLGGGLLRCNCSVLGLEAQQRYFSYRAMLVAIVSQNSFVLVFMGYRANIARYVAKWGIAEMCLCETKYQEGASHHFGGVLTCLKRYREMGYRSDSIAVSRDMGPLRCLDKQSTGRERVSARFSGKSSGPRLLFILQ